MPGRFSRPTASEDTQITPEHQYATEPFCPFPLRLCCPCHAVTACPGPKAVQQHYIQHSFTQKGKKKEESYGDDRNNYLTACAMRAETDRRWSLMTQFARRQQSAPIGCYRVAPFEDLGLDAEPSCRHLSAAVQLGIPHVDVPDREPCLPSSLLYLSNPSMLWLTGGRWASDAR